MNETFKFRTFSFLPSCSPYVLPVSHLHWGIVRPCLIQGFTLIIVEKPVSWSWLPSFPHDCILVYGVLAYLFNLALILFSGLGAWLRVPPLSFLTKLTPSQRCVYTTDHADAIRWFMSPLSSSRLKCEAEIKSPLLLFQVNEIKEQPCYSLPRGATNCFTTAGIIIPS